MDGKIRFAPVGMDETLCQENPTTNRCKVLSTSNQKRPRNKKASQVLCLKAPKVILSNPCFVEASQASALSKRRQGPRKSSTKLSLSTLVTKAPNNLAQVPQQRACKNLTLAALIFGRPPLTSSRLGPRDLEYAEKQFKLDSLLGEELFEHLSDNACGVGPFEWLASFWFHA